MKIKKKKKWKKDLEIPSFYTSVPKIVIIGYTVPEIWHRWIKLLFFILNYTFPFYTSCLLTAQKMKISKKWKKNPGDIIILQNCTKNHDHMLYCSWHMAHNRCNSYFSFCAIFCPLPPQQSEKWKFQKKTKKTGDIIILHKCTKNHDHMLYCPWDMACDACNCSFSF